MKYKLFYPSNVWLTSVILGSTIHYWGYFLLVNPNPITEERFKSNLSTFPLSILITILFSLPTFLLLWLIIHIISVKTSMNILSTKAWLAFIAVVLCALTFIGFGGYDPVLLRIIPCFAIPLIGSIFYFKLRDQTVSY